MAKFDKPVKLSKYHVLAWDESEPLVDDRLFLTGGVREGSIEVTKDGAANKLERLLGGLRYTIWKKTCYRKRSTIIWRASYPTTVGFSGSALLRAGDLLVGEIYPWMESVGVSVS